jgi:hypothetical protein
VIEVRGIAGVPERVDQLRGMHHRTGLCDVGTRCQVHRRGHREAGAVVDHIRDGDRCAGGGTRRSGIRRTWSARAPARARANRAAPTVVTNSAQRGLSCGSSAFELSGAGKLFIGETIRLQREWSHRWKPAGCPACLPSPGRAETLVSASITKSASCARPCGVAQSHRGRLPTNGWRPYLWPPGDACCTRPLNRAAINRFASPWIEQCSTTINDVARQVN